VFGTFAFGFVNQLTGSMRNSALVLAIFFIAGLLALITVRAKVLGRKDKINVAA